MNLPSNERQAAPGNGRDWTALWGTIYAELRSIASQEMARERPGHTLQPTALVNEAYLRLAEQRNLDLDDRETFFAIAANIIRRILIDHARTRSRRKRGRGFVRIALDETLGLYWPPGLDALAVDEALRELEALNERQARIVELRFFGGLTYEDVASILRLSVGTVKREWRFARAWLGARLTSG